MQKAAFGGHAQVTVGPDTTVRKIRLVALRLDPGHKILRPRAGIDLRPIRTIGALLTGRPPQTQVGAGYQSPASG
jgi:hypothetical protein